MTVAAALLALILPLAVAAILTDPYTCIMEYDDE